MLPPSSTAPPCYGKRKSLNGPYLLDFRRNETFWRLPPHPIHVVVHSISIHIIHISSCLLCIYVCHHVMSYRHVVMSLCHQSLCHISMSLCHIIITQFKYEYNKIIYITNANTVIHFASWRNSSQCTINN